MEPRVPRHRYEDPLDRVWLGAAERIGFTVKRSAEVYASTDGRRTIVIGTPETLDPDDCLAQMILHEMCHALVEGDAAVEQVDWGLDNTTDRHAPREHACLRLQAALAAPFGLRWVLAPTTDYRAYYDRLPADPLEPRDDPTCVAARLGARRSERAPWAPHLGDALAATARIAEAVAGLAGAPGGTEGAPASLWSAAEPASAAHPFGFPVARPGTPSAGETCGSCAWRHRARRVESCKQVDAVRSERRRLDPAWPACERWEPALDCQTCGACCRGAYDSVTVASGDPVIRRHPELVVHRETYVEIRRNGDRCAALSGGWAPGDRYACAIYQGRPRVCREFELGSAHCLEARQRVGLSR